MTESTLIKACIDHDRKSQKLLFDSYSGNMYAICLRYLKNEFDAQEALQKSFIKVFKNIHQFNGSGNLGAWIRRIVVNVCIEALRKRKADRLFFTEEDLPEMVLNETDFDEENYKHLLALLDTLPEGYRIVFSMFVIDEYSHAEIAKILGIKESTSRSQLLKARKYLQNLLQKQNMLP